MTRETLIKHWDVIQAFKDGKEIQSYTTYSQWMNLKYPTFDEGIKYRVKPEPTKRLPTIEEVEQWFLESKVFKLKTQPQLYRIECIYLDDKIVRIGKVPVTIETLCEDFTHYDGSELYITE